MRIRRFLAQNRLQVFTGFLGPQIQGEISADPEEQRRSKGSLEGQTLAFHDCVHLQDKVELLDGFFVNAPQLIENKDGTDQNRNAEQLIVHLGVSLR